MVISPEYYQKMIIDNSIEKRKIGLNENVLTGLVSFGAYAPGRMIKIAKELDKVDTASQYVFICGRNKSVRKKLNGLKTNYHKIIVGYVENIPYFMELADFMIGKTGCLSKTEALQNQLPLIIEKNYLTLPQEKGNAQWVADHSAGVVLNSSSQLQKAIKVMENPTRYQKLKDKIKKMNNRSVFEIPDIIDEVMSNH